MDHVQGSLYSMFVVVVGNFWDLVPCSPGWLELLPPSAKSNLTGMHPHPASDPDNIAAVLVWEGQRSMLGFLFDRCPLYPSREVFPRTRSSLASWTVWPVSFRDSPVCVPALGLEECAAVTSVFCGCWGPAIGFHVFAASILLNGLSTHFPGIFLLDHFIEYFY